MAVEVLKDLTRYDSLKVQYQLLSDNVTRLKQVMEQKDKQLSTYKENEGRLNLVIGNQQLVQKSAEQRYKQLEKKYKTAVRVGRFKVVLLIGAAAFGIYKTIK